MIVSRVALKNWKNFRQVEVALRDRAFLVGPNASGKSNFLDVFRFLRDIAKPGGGLQKAVLDRGGISKIRCLAARRSPEVEIDVTLSEYGKKDPIWRYAIGMKQETRGNRATYLIFERVWRDGVLIVDRPNEEDEIDQLRLTQTFLEQINANKEFREVSKFFESIFYLHLVPQLLKHPEAFSGPGLSEDPFGKGFLERIAKVNKNTRAAWLRKIEQALRIAVPQLKELKYTTDLGVPHLEAIYHHWRPKAGKQRENEFSDGTLRLVGLLWSLQEGDSLLLLEEPELSLNAAIVKQLAPMIYRFQSPKKRQVMITTHSGDLISDRGIDPQEILILRPETEGTVIENAYSIREIKDLLESGIALEEIVIPRTRPTNIQQLSLF
ncbi:MAG: AAA family ATPase [Bacteroidota bacterium]